jgi:hypothetical protein
MVAVSVGKFARKVVLAIAVFTFNLCTSQDAFEQKHLETFFFRVYFVFVF